MGSDKLLSSLQSIYTQSTIGRAMKSTHVNENPVVHPTEPEPKPLCTAAHEGKSCLRTAGHRSPFHESDEHIFDDLGFVIALRPSPSERVVLHAVSSSSEEPQGSPRARLTPGQFRTLATAKAAGISAWREEPSRQVRALLERGLLERVGEVFRVTPAGLLVLLR